MRIAHNFGRGFLTTFFTCFKRTLKMKTTIWAFAVLVLAVSFAGCAGVFDSMNDPNSHLNATMNAAPAVGQSITAIAAVTPPPVGTIAAIAGNVILLIAGVYQTVKKSVVENTLATIVKSIEKSPEKVAEDIKARIALNMEMAGNSISGDELVQNIVSNLK
jgi:hypothetical protein